ncbi:hypothetical protein B7P43_G16738 [Cryptotermes secundus]|nr:hypothetical protein B7P43_G16738 [Cryptotermes secundus]
MKRYMCDGLPDCKTGEDESRDECGPNPCENKLRCDDHRCIPIDWCCDTIHDSNCTARVLPPCCLQLSKSFMDHGPGYMNEPPPQGLNDMGFLQTTIYTVVGCAMAFMFIVTILVIAICRVHMKRSLLVTRCPTARGGIMMSPLTGNRAPHHHHHGLQHMPLYDLDVLLNRPSYPPASSVSPHSGLLVTYNINNGVQFVGRPIDPPPYCEIVASPPREGPPPPYASHETLPHANPEASSVDPDSVDDIPCERDSLLGPSTEVEHLENAQLRGNTEYLDTLAPDLLNAGPVFLSGQQRSMQEVDRSCQLGSAISLTVSSNVNDHNVVSSPDTASSLGNYERAGEITVQNGVGVNSCENIIVTPKVPDTDDVSPRNMGVMGKSSPDVSTVHLVDSSVNKISCITQDESSFSVVCHSQENPLQCLHDTFIAIHANQGDLNPRIKSADTATPNVTLGSYARTQVANSED